MPSALLHYKFNVCKILIYILNIPLNILTFKVLGSVTNNQRPILNCVDEVYMEWFKNKLPFLNKLIEKVVGHDTCYTTHQTRDFGTTNIHIAEMENKIEEMLQVKRNFACPRSAPAPEYKNDLLCAMHGLNIFSPLQAARNAYDEEFVL